jgi:mannose-1-phosphate guanylyltransferase
MSSLFVFILAGGSGERFWPMSRAATPKHLLRLLGERTLLEETLLRFRGVVPEDHLFILTNHQQLEGCREAVSWLPPEQFLAEPAKRDTAPAAALATGFARARDKSAICALFPADATIHDIAAFQNNLRDAVEAATSQEALITFAIPPSSASTGFGYLELGEPLAPGGAPGATPGCARSTVRKVQRFVEKPDQATAEGYVASGNYAWNAGMFVWQSAVFYQETQRHAPELATFIENFPTGDPSAYLETHFPTLPKISVDFAIMEKAAAVLSVQASFDWDDVGTWTALPRHLGEDGQGNTVRGPVALVDTSGSIVLSSGRTVALCGVSDLVVVETPDAILICSRDAVQRIKELQPLLLPEVR